MSLSLPGLEVLRHQMWHYLNQLFQRGNVFHPSRDRRFFRSFTFGGKPLKDVQVPLRLIRYGNRGYLVTGLTVFPKKGQKVTFPLVNRLIGSHQIYNWQGRALNDGGEEWSNDQCACSPIARLKWADIQFLDSLKLSDCSNP